MCLFIESREHINALCDNIQSFLMVQQW